MTLPCLRNPHEFSQNLLTSANPHEKYNNSDYSENPPAVVPRKYHLRKPIITFRKILQKFMVILFIWKLNTVKWLGLIHYSLCMKNLQSRPISDSRNSELTTNLVKIKNRPSRPLKIMRLTFPETRRKVLMFRLKNLFKTRRYQQNIHVSIQNKICISSSSKQNHHKNPNSSSFIIQSFNQSLILIIIIP